MSPDPYRQAHKPDPEPGPAYMVVYGIVLALIVLALLVVVLSALDPALTR